MKRICTTLFFLIIISAGLLYYTGQFSRRLNGDGSDSLFLPAPHGIPPIDSTRLKAIQEQLNYFLRTHDVQDEGYDMVAEYAAQLNSPLKRKVQKHVFTVYRKGIWKNGRWMKTPKKGFGIGLDHSGRLLCGIWQGDTIVQATVYDTTGVYHGELNRLMTPDGHGSYTASDGSYYEGHWDNGLRNGFGFSVDEQRIRAGEWKHNVYKGERLTYTTERIYGIDISRYQHGHGRKYYPINWKQLRITHLGQLSTKRIHGVCSYPVSFIFIKSTEGTTIRNPHYTKDYLAARSRGFHIGAYHFFSTKSNGELQARHFIRNTLFRKNDLPPVLDVEPSDQQIKSMGGSQVLFRHIRAWLNYVERHTKARPILYVNQMFVNKYLADAPDLKRKYDVWIARYGEYKPDVRLAIWQLSPDGRVRGIHGEVDINVFNGYKAQYEEFLNENCIK